jgi:hypothetical protein
VFSLSILLPRAIDEAIVAWSRKTPGATVDPQASHVTLLNFETDASEELLLRRVRLVCRHMASFRLVLDQALQEPYLGKPGLDIVMLVPSETSPGYEAALALRQGLLDAFSDLIDVDTTVPEDGEYLPHLTMTAGLPTEEAAALCSEAEKLRIAFEVTEVAAWTNIGGTWRLLELQPLRAAA